MSAVFVRCGGHGVELLVQRTGTPWGGNSAKETSARCALQGPKRDK